MKMVEATGIVLDLAAQQWGLVTSAQAGAVGVNPVMLSRMVDKAILTRIRSGVYAAEATPWSTATNIRAQWLALEPKTMAADRMPGGPRAVVSHESAAELYGIGDLDSHGIHFTVATRRQTRQPEVVFHIDTVDDADWDIVDGLPVTTPLRTVVDLAAAGHEPDHLVDMIGNILQENLATRSETLGVLVGITDVFGISPGNKDELELWLEERFPSQASPAGQILRQQIDAAWAPVREEMRTLMEQMVPSATLASLAQEVLRNTDLQTEVTKLSTEHFKDQEFSAIAAKMLAQTDSFTTLSQPWASRGSEPGKPPTKSRRHDEHSDDERDDKTGDQDE